MYNVVPTSSYPKHLLPSLNENESRSLNSFTFEDDEGNMCEISLQKQNGWVPLSIMVDSGAGESVSPPGMFPNVPIFETTASQSGVEYTAASGHKIPNLGMSCPVVYTTDGSKHIMNFQIAAVTKALLAVSRVTSAGYRVVFDSPECGSFLECKTTWKKIPLRQSKGVYFMDIWMKPGDHFNPKDFTRQAP